MTRNFSNKRLLLRRKSMKLRKPPKSSRKVKSLRRKLHQNQRKRLKMLQLLQLLRLLLLSKKLILNPLNMYQRSASIFITMKRLNLVRNQFLKSQGLINMHQRPLVFSTSIQKPGTATLRTRQKERRRNLLNNGTMMLRRIIWDLRCFLIRLSLRVLTKT